VSRGPGLGLTLGDRAGVFDVDGGKIIEARGLPGGPVRQGAVGVPVSGPNSFSGAAASPGVLGKLAGLLHDEIDSG